MKTKKLKKQLKALRKQVQELQNNKPNINPIGFQQVLRNDDCDNEYDDCGNLSWVERKKK